MSSQFCFRYEDLPVASATGETVLDGLERAGVGVPWSCRAGACQSCVVRAREGSVPASAQRGLRPGQIESREFLACQCPATPDLVVESVTNRPEFEAVVDEIEQLPGDVLRVWLDVPAAFEWRAGQFIHLVRDDGVFRSYSIANLPGSGRLELHVACMPGGAMSTWLSTARGTRVAVRGPFGECVYRAPSVDTPLLLAGTGTGLSPLWGVVRDAVASGHRGPIELIWGSTRSSRLYLLDEVLTVARTVPGLEVRLSSLENDLGHEHVVETSLGELFLRKDRAWKDLEIFLCGNADLVRTLKKKAFLAGAALPRIHSDPFEAARS